MRTKITATSAALAALIGITPVAQAGSGDNTFTLLENLQPEQRQQISDSLNELTKNIDVDWDKIAVGVNEKGELTLRNKKDIQMQMVASLSCGGGVAGGRNVTIDKIDSQDDQTPKK